MEDLRTLFLQLTPEELELVAEGLYVLTNVATLWEDEGRRHDLAELAKKVLLAGKAQEFFTPEAMERLRNYTFPGDDE